MPSSIWGSFLRTATPVVGATVAAYYYKEDKDVFLMPKTAFALSTSYGEKKTFDEHFPRGAWNENWDFRDPIHLVDHKKYEAANEEEKKKLLEEQKATATRNVILIRHGQYKMDTKDKFLTDLGREQAVLIGQRLAESGMKFDSLVMSSMNRATETANLVLEKLSSDLKRSSCSLIEEGPPYPPVPETPHWRPSHSEFFSEGARIESAFRRHIHRASPKQTEDSFELIVCHANVIRYFVCRALQFPPEGWLRMSIGNCSLTWLVLRPNGRVSIRALGDIGHLPKDKISFT